MIYFKTRQLARDFAAKGGKKVIDRTKITTDLVEIFKAASGKRWAVKVL